MQLQPIEQKPMVAEITQRLIDYLLSGPLKPGDRLPPERQLSETLGMGRSTVREALKALTVLGLIDVRQGDGTYLKKADSALLPRVIEWSLLLGEKKTMDLVETRQHLEIASAELAADRRDQQGIEELRQILAQMQRSTADYQRFADADVAFHLQLAKMTGNTVLQDILSSIRALLRAWIVRTIEPTGSKSASPRELACQEHVPIFEAVERGDPKAAAAAMRAHMEAAGARLRKTIAGSQDGTSQEMQLVHHEREIPA
jgi:GntR family transcriptional regulator, transcriptional repressor for pyruvate dehydrogenase complex